MSHGVAAARSTPPAATIGFFRVIGHGVDPELLAPHRSAAARTFFAQLDDDAKQPIAMANAGPAWRGWFPVGGELTSGRPDRKEGLYFGAEHPPTTRGCVAGTPLHGANLFPTSRPTSARRSCDWLDRDAPAWPTP